VIRVWCWYLSP